jgi:tetratricopeptide (TPR) repeat protein
MKPTYEQLYEEGLDSYNSGKYDEALQKFKESEDILKESEDILESTKKKHLIHIHTAKGVTYYKMGKNNESRKSFEKALQYDENAMFTRICLAELYLSMDNPDLAYDQIKDIICEKEKKGNEPSEEEKKDYAYIKEIEGRIKIKKKKYYEASKCFNRGIEYDSDRCKLLLWDVYSLYLSVILYYPPDKISREDLHSIIEKLEIICDYCERKKDLKTERIALYYLGYFYAKSKDYISAIDKLKKCMNIEHSNQTCFEKLLFSIKEILSEFKSLFCSQSKKQIEEQACELLKNIYQRAYNPTLSDWWWNSPLNKKRKRAGFCIITGMIFISVLFLAFYPFFLSKNVNTVLFSFESDDYKGLSPEDKELFIEEKKYQIEQIWTSYTTFKSFSPFLIGFLILILLFPKIETFKAGGVELHMSKSPVPLELFLSPSTMREIMKLE